MDNFKEFEKTVGRLSQIMGEYGAVQKARDSARRMGDAVDGLETRPKYGSQPFSAEEKVAVAAVTSAVRSALIAKAEQSKRKTLASIAAEVESLRAILPALAAKAAVDLGVYARALIGGDKSQGE